MREAEEIAADLQRAALGVRAPRQVAHRSGQGAGAVERALRSEQHLHPLDVVQPQVDRERDVAEVRRDAVVVVVAGGLRPVQRVGVQPAHDDHVAAPRPLVDDGQARRPARQLRQVVDGAALDVGPGHGGDAHRHLPERLLDAGGRHHRRVGERGQPQRDGRQRDRVGADRDRVPRHLPEAAQEHRHRVLARRETVEGEPALGVRLPLPESAGAAPEHDRGAGQDGAGGVGDDAREAPRPGRRGRRERDAQDEEDGRRRAPRKRHWYDCATPTAVSVKSRQATPPPGAPRRVARYRHLLARPGARPPPGVRAVPRRRLPADGRPRAARGPPRMGSRRPRRRVARPVPRRIESRGRRCLPAPGSVSPDESDTNHDRPPRSGCCRPGRVRRTTWYERSRDGA